MTWYIDQGPDSDVIISSRIRLARNLTLYPFPHKMDVQQAKQAGQEIEAAFFGENQLLRKQYLAVELDNLSNEDRLSLAEKHLISDQLARGGTGHRLIINRDESISIMINEEDHIRIQSMRAGLALEDAYQSAAEISLIMERGLSLAYSEDYGFLTACPTNTGTGMRASVMAHLPGMSMAGSLKNIVESLSKLGFAVRGYFGEGSKSQGHLYQISNQLTLGFSEEDLISDLKRIVQQLTEQERQIRRELYRHRTNALEDRIMRAYGILKHARVMSADEAMSLLSDVRLGLALGLIHGVNASDINRLYAHLGPAGIQKMNGRPMSSEERDLSRAEMIRQAL
ncbi:MAG: protein arginine kinase [Clostridiales bacterium]|jgi:protein arginine kinase|nr:protein arginine kinase [Clostridiales bacterium]